MIRGDEVIIDSLVQITNTKNMLTFVSRISNMLNKIEVREDIIKIISKIASNVIVVDVAITGTHNEATH